MLCKITNYQIIITVLKLSNKDLDEKHYIIFKKKHSIKIIIYKNIKKIREVTGLKQKEICSG
jgi:hypothetical protein